MPKQRIAREMIVEAAFQLAQEGGMENVLVKNLAERLGCSVQPVYSYYKNMEDLKTAVTERTKEYLEQYIAKRIDQKNMFQSIGMAHAEFAKEEPYLYRLYYLRKRPNAGSLEEIYRSEANPEAAERIATDLKISLEKAKELYINMMIYNVGLSFILTTLGENTDLNQIQGLLNTAYQAFTEQICGEES